MMDGMRKSRFNPKYTSFFPKYALQPFLIRRPGIPPTYEYSKKKLISKPESISYKGTLINYVFIV
jgi:hypothetical protein